MGEEQKWIEMGPLWNNDDAIAKAKQWVEHNPGWVFTGEWKTTVPGSMSVILVKRAAEKHWIQMGPLWNNDEAQKKGHEWAAQNGGWKFTGNWRTTTPGVMSEIEVEKVPEKRLIEVGPIWNNDDAKVKAQAWVDHNPGWKFTGNWNTTDPGKMSVIEVEKTAPVYPAGPGGYYPQPGQYPIGPGGMPPGGYPGAYPPGGFPPGAFPPGAYPPGYFPGPQH